MEVVSARKHPVALRLGSSLLAAGIALGPLTGCSSGESVTARATIVSAEALPTVDISKHYIERIVEPISGQETLGEKSLENIAHAYTYIKDNYPHFSDQDNIDSLIKLWWKESRWLTDAENPSTGAYGIPQMNPRSGHTNVPPDYYTNIDAQLAWGLQYIVQRYEEPRQAWQHSVENHWY